MIRSELVQKLCADFPDLTQAEVENVVTALFDSITEQLADGGRLVIPIGSDPKTQNLIRVTRASAGFQTEDFGACSFVPLIGEHGWK